MSNLEKLAENTGSDVDRRAILEKEEEIKKVGEGLKKAIAEFAKVALEYKDHPKNMDSMIAKKKLEEIFLKIKPDVCGLVDIIASHDKGNDFKNKLLKILGEDRNNHNY